ENLRRDPLNVGAHYSLSNFITYQPTDEIFTCLPSLLEGEAYWDIGDAEKATNYVKASKKHPICMRRAARSASVSY
ncbi:MAG: hypothetical protein ACTID3_02455, partial [Halomonas sp.]|uniref:hypothetical protein n=1 Tax=Halomonas sp. TaxID=1486246 RepID=UPI003F9101AE